MELTSMQMCEKETRSIAAELVSANSEEKMCDMLMSMQDKISSIYDYVVANEKKEYIDSLREIVRVKITNPNNKLDILRMFIGGIASASKMPNPKYFGVMSVVLTHIAIEHFNKLQATINN